MQLFIHSQTSTKQPLKFEGGWVISSCTLQGILLLIHAGIKSWSVLLKGAPDKKTIKIYLMNYAYH